jgi:two-component system CheB/CheR fusion protein
METLIKNPSLEISDYTGKRLSPEYVLERITELAVCLTDQHGNFVDVNDSYTEFYGYSKEELIGQHFTMVVPEEGKAYAAQVHKDFINGKLEMPADWQVQGKDGELKTIHVESIRIVNKDDEEAGPSKMTIIELKA